MSGRWVEGNGISLLVNGHRHQIVSEQMRQPRSWTIGRSFFAFHMIRRDHLRASWLTGHMSKLHPAMVDPLGAFAHPPQPREAP